MNAIGPSTPAAPRRRAFPLDREGIAGWLMISPWLVGLAALTAYPFVASLYWSFCRYDLMSSPQWVGWANYHRLAVDLIEGGEFARALGNTAYFSIGSVACSVVLGIGLAVALSWEFRGRAICRTLCFLPSVVPAVAAAMLWMWLLDPQQGAVNGLLSYFGVPPQNWFQGSSAAAWPPSWPVDHAGRICGSKDGLIVMSMWGVGNLMLIYLAALQDAPTSLYEAAQIDGAGRLGRFWHVTLPLLTPAIFFNVVIGLIQSLQAFTQVYLVSDGTGAPAGATMTLSLYLFLTAFKNLQMGYASAMAWTLLVIVAAVTVWLFRTSGRWVHYQGTPTRR